MLLVSCVSRSGILKCKVPRTCGTCVARLQVRTIVPGDRLILLELSADGTSFKGLGQQASCLFYRHYYRLEPKSFCTWTLEVDHIIVCFIPGVEVSQSRWIILL
jgi:hypothetical protein